jgi:uncharacterized protein YndB with AHSA1/START domain
MRLGLLLAAVLLAAPAYAQDYAAAPVVTGQRLGEDGGAARASMDVRAPPAAVWAVLADCPNATRYMRHLISCRVLDRGAGWEVREHRMRAGPFRGVLRNVSRIALEPYRRLSFQRIAGDWSRSEGEWRLTPIDSGRGTRVEYEISAAMDGGLPAGVSQSFLYSSVRHTLAALRREAERRPEAS